MLQFDFVVNKEEKTITIKREFAASATLVWDAFTKKELLEQWWAPKPWKAKIKTLDLKDGGIWHYAMMGPNGEVHWALTKFEKVVPGKKYTSFDSFTDEAGNINKDMPQSYRELTLTNKGEHTLVEYKLTYTKLAELEVNMQMGFKEGMTMTLNYLDELLPRLNK